MRHAIMRAHVYTLIQMCKHGCPKKVKVIANALPDDAEFVRAGHDNMGYLFLVLESKEFKDLQEGDLIPELPDPAFEREPD